MPPKPLAVKLTIIEYNDIGIYQVGIYSTCELIKNRINSIIGFYDTEIQSYLNDDFI